MLRQFQIKGNFALRPTLELPTNLKAKCTSCYRTPSPHSHSLQSSECTHRGGSLSRCQEAKVVVARKVEELAFFKCMVSVCLLAFLS